jgi:hypothetical protein
MMLRVALILSVTLSLAACDSRINPLNWFGGDREQRVTIENDATGRPVVVDGRILVSELIQLSVEQTTSGAIIRATGVVPVQGYYDAELVLIERTASSVVYEFRVEQPLDNAIAGIQQISVGTELSVGELAGVRSITVIAATNRRSVARR